MSKTRRFFCAFGNPPYQDESNGNGLYSPPIYHEFMLSTYSVAERAVIVTPARFLFNAGGTPKAFNKAMLNSEHIAVTNYWPNG